MLDSFNMQMQGCKGSLSQQWCDIQIDFKPRILIKKQRIVIKTTRIVIKTQRIVGKTQRTVVKTQMKIVSCPAAQIIKVDSLNFPLLTHLKWNFCFQSVSHGVMTRAHVQLKFPRLRKVTAVFNSEKLPWSQSWRGSQAPGLYAVLPLKDRNVLLVQCLTEHHSSFPEWKEMWSWHDFDEWQSLQT